MTPGGARPGRQALLDAVPAPPAAGVSGGERTAAGVVSRLRRLHEAGELDLPLPGAGDTARRWARLARWGRQDLTLARLAEGHTDAMAIAAEAGRRPVPGALYGVWASRAGGTGATLRRTQAGWELSGRVRFCSGAGHLDRALVAASGPAGESLLVDVDLGQPQVETDPASWPALGMDASASFDVVFRGVALPEQSLVGPPGFYTARCGFALGGAGVAAVWLGGAAGAVDLAVAAWPPSSDPGPHRLAHLGALLTDLAACQALLEGAAVAVDAAPDDDHTELAALCRSAAESSCRRVLDLVPRMVGPGPLCWDRRLAQHLADLAVYVRQHHGESDLAALAGRALARLRGEG